MPRTRKHKHNFQPTTMFGIKFMQCGCGEYRKLRQEAQMRTARSVLIDLYDEAFNDGLNATAKNDLGKAIIDQALLDLQQVLVPEEKKNNKSYFTYTEGFDDGWDACRQAVLRRMRWEEK